MDSSSLLLNRIEHYSQAFGRWLQQHRVFTEIKESTRTWLYRCYEHRFEILKWRGERGAGEITRYNYPETVFKRWEKATNPQAAIVGGEREDKTKAASGPSAVQLRAELEAAQAHIAELEAMLVRFEDERKTLIDPLRDTGEKIARSLVDNQRGDEIVEQIHIFSAGSTGKPSRKGRGVKALDDPSRPRNRVAAPREPSAARKRVTERVAKELAPRIKAK